MTCPQLSHGRCNNYESMLRPAHRPASRRWRPSCAPLILGRSWAGRLAKSPSPQVHSFNFSEHRAVDCHLRERDATPFVSLGCDRKRGYLSTNSSRKAVTTRRVRGAAAWLPACPRSARPSCAGALPPSGRRAGLCRSAAGGSPARPSAALGSAPRACPASSRARWRP